MKKKIVIGLWISLVMLVIVFGCLVVYQNKMEAEKAAEQARIEQEQKEEEIRIAEEKAAEAAKLTDEKESEAADKNEKEKYTFTDFEATYFAQSNATVREEPFDTAEVIGTLSLDQSVSMVEKCNQTV